MAYGTADIMTNLWLGQKLEIHASYRNYFLFKLIYLEYYISHHSF